MRTLFFFLLAVSSVPAAAQNLLGSEAQVQTLLLPNQTPHFAAYTPAQLQQVRDADVLVWLGEEAEPHLSKLLGKRQERQLSLLSLSGLEVLDADGHHEHGEDAHHGDHEEASLDPHLWLSQRNMRVLARAIAAIARQQGADANVIDANLKLFDDKLQAWREASMKSLAPVREVSWLSHHNPWRYLQLELNIRAPIQVSAALQSGISSRQLVELRGQVAERNVKCVMAEPEAQLSLLRTLCPDCEVVQADPLGRDAAGGNYSAFLTSLTHRFQTCLSQN